MSTTLDYSDKNVIGNAAWKVLHAYAAQYPEKPTQDDKKEYHSLLKSVLRTIPDDDCRCRTHAVDYIQKNPPNMSNRKDLVMWTCNFHNDANKRLGKHEYNCETLFTKKACPTCKPSIIIQDKDAGLKKVMGDYKQLSVQVFDELCKRENLPSPTIVFAPCPEATHTSCTTMVVNKDTQDINTRQKPVVYINPSNFGLRVLGHEALHYITKMKKQNNLAVNEDEIERRTQEIIAKYFPADSYDLNKKQLIQPMIMKDTLAMMSATKKQSVQTEEKEKKSIEPVHSYNKGFNTSRFSTSIAESFPMYSKYKNDNKRSIEDGNEGGDDDHSDTNVTKGGLLSYFDGLYEPFAKMMHISARELNLANTPNIFSEGTKMLLNTQLTPFGAILSSTLVGLAMYVATALNREGISYEDRRLLAQLGGQFLWGGIQSANNPALQETALAAGNSIAVMDWPTLQSLIVKPSSFLTQQEAGVQARNQQRTAGSGGRTGSGSIGKGGGRVTSGPQGMLQRNLEKEAGIDTRPEGAGIFRNFGSGAGAGFAVPRNSGSGGIGFSYSPIINRIGLSQEEKDLIEGQGMPTDTLYYDDAESLV